jgi:hypothetical protein
MTHDELLMRLWEKRNVLCDNLDVHFALSAVVELHKPDDESYSGVIGCIGCGFNSEYGTWEQDYPCPTIQAIEKELG